MDFRDKYDIINSCKNNGKLSLHNKTWIEKIFTQNDTNVNFSMIHIQSHMRQEVTYCEALFEQDDCFLETTFNKVKTRRIQTTKVSYLGLDQEASKEPSFDIRLQPKIEDVDYVTYILVR